MKRIQYWLWSIGALVLLAAAFLIYWRYDNWLHATPQKTQSNEFSGWIPFRTIHFEQGVVLFSNRSENAISMSYMTRDFWGWHIVETSELMNSSSKKTKAEFGTNVGSMVIVNNTLIWSTFMRPKEIIEHHNGKVFRTTVKRNSRVWYMVLPFKQHRFPYSEWTMVLPNGKTVSLFKQS